MRFRGARRSCCGTACTCRQAHAARCRPPRAVHAQRSVTPPSSVAKVHPEKQARESAAPVVGAMACGASCHVTRSLETAWPHTRPQSGEARGRAAREEACVRARARARGVRFSKGLGPWQPSWTGVCRRAARCAPACARTPVRCGHTRTGGNARVSSGALIHRRASSLRPLPACPARVFADAHLAPAGAGRTYDSVRRRRWARWGRSPSRTPGASSPPSRGAAKRVRKEGQVSY
jgi:hypothetical protein